jgi:hypothetical protein
MPRVQAGAAVYRDVETIFDAALNNNGAVHVCASDNAAKQLVNRLCSYRMLDRGRDRDGVSLYDRFMVRRRANKVLIELRPDVFPGETYTLDGQPIDMAKIVADNRALRNYLADEQLGGGFDPDKPLGL